MASSVTDTAKKILWGEQANVQGNETAGQEPISGEQGAGTIDSPYDKGNEDQSRFAASDQTGLASSNQSGVTSTGQTGLASGGQSGLTATDRSGLGSGLDSANKSDLTSTSQSGLGSTTQSGLGATTDSGLGAITESGLGSTNQSGLGSTNQAGISTGGRSGVSDSSGVYSPQSGLDTTGRSGTGPRDPASNVSKATTASSGALGASGSPGPTDDRTAGQSGTRSTALAGQDVGAADPSSAQQPKQKQQGADRPLASPSPDDSAKPGSHWRDSGVDTGSAPGEGKDDTAWRSERSAKRRDPNDHSGEPLKMHDGSEKPAGGAGGEERRESSGLPRSDGKGDGTGQHVVKTTGLAAEGGDFDATKPGAGVEAARIKEEHGIGEGGSKTAKDAWPSGGGHTTSTGETSPTGSKRHKLLEKLHIHKKHE